MSLTERFFPVMRHDFNFFDAQAAYMEREFRQRENQVETLQQHMDRQMAAMRSCMFQLIPSDPNDVAISEIETNRPIVEEKGETKLKLEFNVQGFKPEEIKVKVLGNNILQVHARSDTKTESGETHRMFVRQFSLPKGVEADKIRPMLTKDGVLTIEAPAPQLKPTEKLIPIQYTPAAAQIQ
jgi:HSP20 family molecular chaperone IbpA